MRKATIGLLVSLAAVLGMYVAASPSHATSCSTVMQKTVVPYDYDTYRTRVTCSSISSNTKAQGILYRSGLDKYTQWFTRTYTYYYTGWYVWGTGSGYKTAPV